MSWTSCPEKSRTELLTSQTNFFKSWNVFVRISGLLYSGEILSFWEQLCWEALLLYPDAPRVSLHMKSATYSLYVTFALKRIPWRHLGWTSRYMDAVHRDKQLAVIWISKSSFLQKCLLVAMWALHMVVQMCGLNNLHDWTTQSYGGDFCILRGSSGCRKTLKSKSDICTKINMKNLKYFANWDLARSSPERIHWPFELQRQGLPPKHWARCPIMWKQEQEFKGDCGWRRAERREGGKQRPRKEAEQAESGSQWCRGRVRPEVKQQLESAGKEWVEWAGESRGWPWGSRADARRKAMLRERMGFTLNSHKSPNTSLHLGHTILILSVSTFTRESPGSSSAWLLLGTNMCLCSPLYQGKHGVWEEDFFWYFY